MSDREDEVMLAEPRKESSFGDMMARNQEVMVPGQQLTPRQVGDMFGTLTTAQPVVKYRDHKRLMQTLKTLTATFGDSYMYSWTLKGGETVEGPTIKMAMDLVREYGNCSVDVREIEGPTHWVFYARFVDLESGFTLTRAFRQRKGALQGKYEDDRKLDMAYQIGQSKASRNVVVNALANYVDFMVEETKASLIDTVGGDKEKILKRIENTMKKFNISEASVTAQIGRARADWTVRDIAKVYSQMLAIWDGMVSARDVFPQDGPSVDGDEVVQEDQTSSGSESPADSAEPGRSTEAKSEGGNSSREAPSTSSDDAESKPKTTAKKSETKATAAEKPAAEPTKKPAVKKPAALF